LKEVLKLLKKVYYDVLKSIAFYPVLISLGFFVLAMIVLELENTETVVTLKKNLSYLFIQDFETARAILSTFIGGILSLTVFSFTMVMVVLNQASSNFSPRLLPNLISNKKHQIILGIYIGTLLYCTIVLIYLGAYGIDSESMGLSTMLAALFALICIGFFVYFIHSISTAIQINHITNRIFRSSMKYLEAELKDKSNQEVSLHYIDTENWHAIYIAKNGYYKGFDVSLMTNSLLLQNNQIEVIPYVGQHIWKGMPVLRTKHILNKEEQQDLLFCLDISSKRHEGDKGISGMIKLMEIAVKALSPGINDPGTAIDALDNLAELLRVRLQFSKVNSTYAGDGETLLIRNNISAHEIMRIVVQPIRNYAKNDSAVLFELVATLHFIAKAPNLSKEDSAALAEEKEALRFDVEKHIYNPIDRKRILDYLEHG
tara:strand:+ start:75012 stop:76298 length:1287 start_codon:yes stop_codon:yes gene_type:complete